MARKLNSEEQRLFRQLIERDNSAAIEMSSDLLLQMLAERENTSLDLSPELSLWFADEVSALPR